MKRFLHLPDKKDTGATERTKKLQNSNDMKHVIPRQFKGIFPEGFSVIKGEGIVLNFLLYGLL